MIVRQALATEAVPEADALACSCVLCVIVDPLAGTTQLTVGLLFPGVVLPFVETMPLVVAFPVLPCEPVAVTVQVRVCPAVSLSSSRVSVRSDSPWPSRVHW